MYRLLHLLIFSVLGIGCAHGPASEKAPEIPFLPPSPPLAAFEAPQPEFAMGEHLLWGAKVMTAAGKVHDPSPDSAMSR